MKFVPGRVIEIPDVKPEQRQLLDAEVARHFYQSSDHFYAATINKIEAVLSDLDREMRSSALRGIVEASELPSE